MNEAIHETLREMLRWIRVSAFPNVHQMLSQALPETKHRIAYQAVDGSHTIKGVQASAGIGQQAVYDLIDTCVAMGLMEKDEKGKVTRVFDLNDFSLMPPPVDPPAVDQKTKPKEPKKHV